MSYSILIDVDFGSGNAGITPNGKLFDATGAQVGTTKTTGFAPTTGFGGQWSYLLDAPDNHVGKFVVYDAANTDLRRVVVIAPRETENADTKTSTRATPTNVTDAQTAIETAIAALNDLSTADVATELATYNGATQSDLTTTQTAITNAIAALNNLSQAQAQAAATAALNAYDPPTKAELDTAQAAITTAIPGVATIAAAVMAEVVETGHDVTTVLRAVYAVIRGRSVADDGADPTEIIYYAPDDATARVTHTLTDTERTVA